MRFDITITREGDGRRFIAEVPSLPSVLAYGASAEEAGRMAAALVLRVLAEQIEHGEHGKHELIDYDRPSRTIRRREANPWLRAG